MKDNKTIEVVTFDPKFLSSYIEYNRDWIETYFEIEPLDTAQLEDPFSKILNDGGEIFFVLENGISVGTCAMVPHGPGSYEVAKMAVGRSFRGRGFGDLLMRSVIQWAQLKNANRITLLSNTILKPAIELYKKHGFKTIHLGDHPDYKRCNIKMELEL